MTTTAARTARIAEVRVHPKDSGSCEVQVALLTDRITSLTEHLKTHSKDSSTRRGLMRMVCIDDGGLKLIVTVKDAPPPRARSICVPLGLFADDLASGTSFDDIVKRLSQLRT